MDTAASQFRLLLELDDRHDDLLRRLEELDHRVARVLAQYEVSQKRSEPPALDPTEGVNRDSAAALTPSG